MLPDMKDEHEHTHELDTWTPLGWAAAALTMKLRGQAQPNTPHLDRSVRIEIKCDESAETQVEVRSVDRRAVG
jgi:hypothetical protein